MKGIQRAKNVLMPSNAFYRKQRQIANKQVDLHEIFKNARIEALQASKQSRKDKAEKAQQAKKGKALARRQRDLRRKQRQQKRSVKLNNENRAPPSWRTEQDDLMFNSKGEPLMVPSFPFPPKSFLEQKPEQGSPSKAQLRRLATLKFSKPIYTAPMTM
jgi:hypothetical protein